MDTDEILRIILQDKAFYDESGGGVTFSGGEPTMQKEFLKEILPLCRKNGIHTAIETNLTVKKEVIDSLIPLVNLWMCDFKIADPALHRQWTGVSNEAIIDNLRYLSSKNIPVILRTPVIPGVNGNEQAIKDICEVIRDLPGISYELLGFHSLGFNKFEHLGMDNPLSNASFLDKELFSRLKAIPPTYNIVSYEK